jgi:hypothetical protein
MSSFIHWRRTPHKSFPNCFVRREFNIDYIPTSVTLHDIYTEWPCTVHYILTCVVESVEAILNVVMFWMPGLTHEFSLPYFAVVFRALKEGGRGFRSLNIPIKRTLACVLCCERKPIGEKSSETSHACQRVLSLKERAISAYHSRLPSSNLNKLLYR